MKNKLTGSLLSSSGRLFAAGLAAMTILAGSLQGQYVATVITNGLNSPYSVTTDPNNNVYVADTLNDRILLYVPGTKVLSNLAGSVGVSGNANGSGANALFSSPEGIVYAPGRNALVVVDQGNQELRLVTTNGVVTAPFTGVQLAFPAGIAVANDGVTLYVADQSANAICMVNSSNVISIITNTYTYGGVSHRFNNPAAVAVDNNSNIWVTDSANAVICMITNGAAIGVAGAYRSLGSADGLASAARFNLPSGLVWDNAKQILVIADSDNDTIRGLYFTNGAYYVQTLAGLVGMAGLVDGTLATAEFNQPFGLAIDLLDSGYYVADSKNNAVRVLQPTQPPPPPTPIDAPVIGYITFPLINDTPSAQFNPITSPVAVFNNYIDLAIQQNEGGVLTYMNYGPTGTPLTPPSSNTYSADPFTSADVGLLSNQVPNLNISIIPALTLEAVSIAKGRPNSPSVGASIQFVTANPDIIGNDAAAIVLSNLTLGALMYYVLDNSTNQPTDDGTYGIGPYVSGTTLVLNITSNTTLKVRAFAKNFAPSGTVSEALTVSNFIGDQLTFGFQEGNSSSKFLTAAGRYYYAPVTLTLLPGATMYSLQFNLTETNIGAAPQINSSTWQFESFLRTPVLVNGVTVLEEIPPNIITTNTFIFTNSVLTNVVVTNISGTNITITTNTVLTNVVFTNYVFTNVNGTFTNDNILGVSWIEIYPETNLYPTTKQDLITYSEAHDQEFLEAEGQAVVGTYSFGIPPSAANGSQYRIQANLPSATTYNPPSAEPFGVFLQAPTNGSLTNGPINAIKTVTVTNVSYLVGDAYPFSWLNAGDFGDTNLENDDVIEVFQSAIYQLSIPPANSDYFDAMDSADGGYNFYDTGDAAINAMTNGDGVLDVNDVYVTLKRSLDTNLTWYTRNWSGGHETVTAFTNFVTFGVHAATVVNGPASAGTPRQITVAADQVISGGDLSVSVPVRVLAADPIYPIRVMMLNVDIIPLDGSPAITTPATFSPGGGLGQPTLTSSQGINYGAAWLDSTVSGISGTSVIGSVFVTLPPTVNSNSAYLVHFEHFSASPNGVALFKPTIQDGLITVGNRSGSSWRDGIPDSWRLLWFNTVSNSLSAATADPDGDGANNWQEYVAGTNPNDPASVFQFVPGSAYGSSGFTMQWASVANKHYTVQSSFGLTGQWSTRTNNILGNGQTMQWTDTSAAGKSQFYRAFVQ